VATVEPPPPRVVTKPFTGRLKWILIGGLAILIMFQIVYSFAFLLKAPTPPRPIPAPAPAPPPPEVIVPPITKGEVLFFEDFESGSQNWKLKEGWYLEKIGDNTVLKGRGHTWAILEDRDWDNYAFEAKFKLIKGTIHFNYRRSTPPERSRYFIGVSNGGIYLNKVMGDQFFEITQALLNLDEGWHEIEIIGYRNAIHVYIDDALLIFYKDDNSILSGGIAFMTLEDSEFLIDDVRITETTGAAPIKPKPTPAGPKAVTPADRNLEAALRDALGKPPGEEITTAELAKLTELEAEESGIADLSGLEYCTSLTALYLGGNQISDITPLENLTSLIALELGENQISDISPLENLTSLNALRLGENQISDISPLENLKSLNGLELGKNQISDISPLENLTSLTRLVLGRNQISDISPLENLTSLTRLSLNENEISDISLLENLTSLIALYLRENQISDITPLENLTSLNELILNENEISDITPLENLTRLNELILNENEISDISPLENLTSLTELGLDENEISDITPLENLTSLNVLELNENEISDISALVENSGLDSGDEVWLEDNNLDLSEGSEDMENIGALEDRGVRVRY